MKHIVLSMLAVAAAVITLLGSCSVGINDSKMDVTGLWAFFSYSAQDANQELGWVDLRADGGYTYDVTNAWYGHRIGGGTWSYTGNTLELKPDWDQWDGAARVDHEPVSWSGTLTDGAGICQLKAGDFSWTMELSRGGEVR